MPADPNEGAAMAVSKNTWAMLCHLIALVGFLGVPLGHILGPLIVWLIKKDEYSFVDSQGRESLNFQISMTIYGVIAGFLTVILIGWFLLAILVLMNIIFVILASVRANSGRPYRYPITIRFL
jgi:uncharacterized Tic20 family protein